MPANPSSRRVQWPVVVVCCLLAMLLIGVGVPLYLRAVRWHAVGDLVHERTKRLYPLGASIYSLPNGDVYSIEFKPPLSSNLKSEDLRYLSSIETLQILDLRGTAIADDGLRYLAGLKQLQQVVLIDTKVSSEGITFLRRSLPGCQIIWDGQTSPSTGRVRQDTETVEGKE
jgi:hypothetical protein